MCLWFLIFCTQTASLAAPITMDEAAARARMWMTDHPVMGKAAREIQSAEAFPSADATYPVYVIKLAPAGYLILNSDDLLPLVVAFSESSPLSLDDIEGNSFRAFIEKHIAQTAEQIARQPSAIAAESLAALNVVPPPVGDELIGPLLDSTWNQCHPYNLYAPADPGGTSYYGYRAPTGCVPTAFAQILNYHRWPVRGKGSHSYSDTSGVIQGSHDADFSDPYDWSAMQLSYSAYGENPEAGMNAVAELSYELGVAAEADYEGDGTSSSTTFLGAQLAKHFHFGDAANRSTQAELLPALENDLRSGYPSVVSIPGHAVIVDGLLTSGGSTTYHINYGWGGTNNGWWSANSVPGGAISSGVTSLVPKLMPFPLADSKTVESGGAFELEWLLPKRREDEADKLLLYWRESHSQPWTSDGSSFGHAAVSQWSVVPDGKAGSCLFAGPSGPAIFDFDETFIPDTSTDLQFWQRHRLGSATFTISVSTDNGATFTPLFSRNNNYDLTWRLETVSLAAYAGTPVLLRMELGRGSFYSEGGGVWIDELAMTSGSWSEWTPLSQAIPLGSRRFSAVTSLWDDADNFTNFAKTSTSSYKDWAITTLDTGGTGFYKEAGGYDRVQYHLTSLSTIVPTANTRLRLRAKYNLASDGFRVLVSTDRKNFTPLWTGAGSSEWADLGIALGAYAGQAIYVRLEYLTGSYFTGGGIWIDSISTELVTNPELEGQPLHLTALDPLAPGTYQLAGAIIDHDQQEHPISPAFTLQVSPATSHRVTFVLGEQGVRTGGGALEQTVATGTAATAPLVAPHPGWLFSSWDTPFDAVTADLDVTAIYTAKLATGGTPHWWLILQGFVAADAPDSAFDAAEASDPLGKGQPLRTDFLFGTDPNDPSSRFQMEMLPVAGGQVSLRWTGRAGRIYRVLRSPSPAGQPWQEITSLPCMTDGLPMTYSENIGAAGSDFYRLGVSLTE